MNAEDPSLTKNPIFRAGALGIALLMVVVGAVWIVVPGEQGGDASGRQTSFGEDSVDNAVVQPLAEASSATGPGSPGVDQYAQPFSESIPGDGVEQGFNEAMLNEQSGPAGEGSEPESLGSAVDDSSELDALPNWQRLHPASASNCSIAQSESQLQCCGQHYTWNAGCSHSPRFACSSLAAESHDH